MGRESRDETGESLAPEKPDELIMGTSVQWYSEPEDAPSAFPDCPWALQFNEDNCQRATKGDWDCCARHAHWLSWHGTGKQERSIPGRAFPQKREEGIR